MAIELAALCGALESMIVLDEYDENISLFPRCESAGGT